MEKGGLLYEQRTLTVMKLIGLVTPLFMFGYGLLIMAGFVASDNYKGLGLFIGLMTFWLALGIHQFVYPAQTKQHMLVNLTLYHVLAAIYIIAVSGFTVPFLSAWALLYLASYVYFSYLGVFTSAVCFFLILVIDGALNLHHSDQFIFNIVASVATLLVGAAAIALNRIKEYDREAIAKSQRGEALQRDRILTLINNLADAIVSTDEKGTIQVYNAAALNLLDTNAGLNDQSIDDVLNLSLDGAKVHLLPLLKKAKGVTVSDDFTSKIGDETVRLEVTYAPIRGSFEKKGAGKKEQDGYVIIFRDVTKAKSLEEERDEFISVVSHELRTPIAVTEGAIDNARLIFEKDSSKKEAVQTTLKLAHDQIIFLSKMVNDLSTLSRAERGVADVPESIDVMELAHSLHAEYSPEAEKKGLHFNLSAHGKLGTVSASRLYLHELMQNFITNAIKYTKEGRIDLIVERSGDTVSFAVVDTGIGISKSDQAKIFQKFYRAEDYRTRETSGTGLGLYVAVKLAKKLGTEIHMKSRLNHGSTFSFELPVEAETTTHPASDSDGSTPAPSPNAPSR